MRRPAILLFCLLACSNESSSEASNAAAKSPMQAKPAPAKAPELPEPPAFLLLPWDTKLRIAPEQYAPALTLVGPSEAEAAKHGRGRVIKVAGKADKEGRWWKLETVSDRDAAIPSPTIEGLGVYALSLYVPAGTGEAIAQPTTTTPGADTAVLDGSPAVLQSGAERPPGLEKEWQIDPGAKVFWPNGATAGTVRTTHAFVEAGESKKLDGRELLCFAIRIGPRVKSPTELCYDPTVVREVIPPDPMELLAEDLETLEALNSLAIIGVLSADDEMQDPGPGLDSLIEANAFGVGDLEEDD
jgi:hypothetical protein